MPSAYKGTDYRGVRYREHPTRRNGTRPDRYYVIRYKDHGKQRQESLGWGSEGWSPAKAYSILSDIRANIRTGSGHRSLQEMREAETQRRNRAEAKRRGKPAFAQVGQAFVDEHSKPTKKSWGHDQTRLDLHLVPVLGHISIDQITREDVEAMRATCQAKGMAPATVVRCLALCRSILNFAIRKGLRPDNPVKGVKFPRVNNQRMRILSPEEEAAFFDMARTLGKIEAHDICLLSLYTGLRMGEVFALRGEDVDLAAATILVKGPGVNDAPKSGASRVAYITEKIAPMIRERLALLDGPAALLFPGPDGSMRTEIGSTFKTVIRYLGWNEGITDRRVRVCAHTFRHTFATRLVEKNTPLPVVQKLMGHTVIQTTMRYVTVNDPQCREAVAAL